jgi:hypothetical protein
MSSNANPVVTNHAESIVSNQPIFIASAPPERNLAGDVLSVLTPDAVIAGGTMNLPLVGKVGTVGIFPSTNPEDAVFFGLKPVGGRIGSIPFTDAPVGLTVVGTFNHKGAELGVGLFGRLPTPFGDVALFVNVRGGNIFSLLEDSKKNPDRSFTVSVNLGAALSVTDLAARGLTVTTGGAAAPVIAAFEAAQGDLWVGAGYRASITVRNGEIVGLKVSGVDIPMDQIGSFLGQKVANDVAPQTAVSNPAARDPNSRAYQVGDGIGIPGAGNLVYNGSQSDGYYHVASRTADYRVPPSVGYDKDAIRSWAIAAVANGAIGRNGLYGAPTVGETDGTSITRSRSYRAGDYVGTPYGQLVFKGRKDDGFLHVDSRTGSYRIPTELGNDRDAIRGWVINAIEHGGIDQRALYPNRTSTTLVDGDAVATAANQQTVRTVDNRELVVVMQANTPVVTSDGAEILRLREGTSLAQAALLVGSSASPVLGKGVQLTQANAVDTSVQSHRNINQPGMHFGLTLSQ